MTNKDIAKTFQELARIMELHEENPFKIRSYSNAYITLRKWGRNLSEMTEDEIGSIKGVGKTITSKIKELLHSGKISTLEEYKAITPEGVTEMLNIKGFGPKKIRIIWKDLGITGIGELLYACNENRLVEVKGFGTKTQEDLKNKLAYFIKSKGKYLYATLEDEMFELKSALQNYFPGSKIHEVGEIIRKNAIVSGIEFLVTNFEATEEMATALSFEVVKIENEHNYYKTSNETPLVIHKCSENEFGSKIFRYSGSNDFLRAFVDHFPGIDFKNLDVEVDIFKKINIPFIPYELREDENSIVLAKQNKLPQLITESDIKGVVHCHSTYSDGLHSLKEMALAAQTLNYEYLVMSDHSKSAFYANGLSIERVEMQWREIDELNAAMAPFKTFKSIESDILNDGTLDYPDQILKGFDLVISSIHSNLKMDKDKATMRLIKAIENPFTTILGHPTGRLLLSREGYPIDHMKVIDACASNAVCIEINSNPYRLDLDWTWLPYALEKGVSISINPDAHSKEGISDIKYGVYVSRKGGLRATDCLNAKSLSEFEECITGRRPI